MTAPTQMHLQFLGAVPGYVLGSMTAGSYTLTLATTDHQFRPGSRIIGEIGGEAGAGARATVGVGGTWPEHSFADEATLLASGAPGWTTVTGDPAAYARDTGRAFRYNAGDGGWLATYGGSAFPYEQRLFIPRALEAYVDAVDGATLTLNVPSVAATTNARFWYDNHDAFDHAVTSQLSSVRVPADTDRYAIGSAVHTDGGAGAAADGVTVFGDSKTGSQLYQPLGCQLLEIRLHDGTDITVSDMALERAWIEEGAAWNGADGFVISSRHTIGVYGVTAHRPKLQRLRLIDGLWGEAVLSLCSDGEIRDCDVVRTFPARHYASWAIQLADCTDCFIINPSFDSDAMGEAFEVFKGVGCGITGATARNGLTASNTNDTPTLSGWSLRYEAGASTLRIAADPSYDSGPIAAFNHNNNFLQSYAEGGYLRDSRIEIEGDVGGTYGMTALYSRHSAMPAAGDPFTLGPGLELITNGVCVAISAVNGVAVQQLVIDGLTTDGVVRLEWGSVANTVAAELKYCSGNVTLGSGNTIPILTVQCS